MKKYLIALIILIILIGAGWYVWEGVNARTYYEGFAEIEPVALEEVARRLDEAGCNKNSSCYYTFNTEKNSLTVSPIPRGFGNFGPMDGFIISDGKVFAEIEIQGRPSLKRFEEAVMKDIERRGNVVTPIEGTWTIIKTEDRTGVVY